VEDDLRRHALDHALERRRVADVEPLQLSSGLQRGREVVLFAA